MAITTYAELQTAVASWLHRSDLTSVIPDFIRLAEARFNSRLRTKEQETALSSTAIDASYQIAIPANTVAIKTIWRVSGTEKYPLLPAPLENIISRQDSVEAERYAWEGDYWRFDGTGSVAGVLYRDIPALASASTNWLLTAAPDLYLYSALMEAMVYLRDTDGIQFFESRAMARLETVQREHAVAQFTGPLMVRAR